MGRAGNERASDGLTSGGIFKKSTVRWEADVVIFVFREEYCLKSRGPEPGRAEHAKWMEKLERATNRAEVKVLFRFGWMTKMN